MRQLQRRSLPSALISAACLLAGCGPEPANEMSAPVPRLPEQTCRDAAKALEDLKGKLPFEYNKDGTATIAQEAWLTLPEASRKSLADALGYHAACAAAQPQREQEVAVKSETGQVLTRRYVKTVPEIPGLN